MNIVLCYELDASLQATIQQAAPDCRIICSSQGQIAQHILDADIFCGHAKVAIDWEEVVEQGRLKWIQSSAAGLDHCLTGPIKNSAILVTGASGLFCDSVAEQTMALLYGLMRRLPVFIRAAEARQFERLPTDDLHGKTIGIVGFGGNGQRIAELLLPTRCRILATDRCPDEWRETRSLPPIEHLWPETKLSQLLGQSDVVILTVPLTPATNGMVGAKEIALMPQGAYLINVARGQILQPAPLIQALATGRLSGAGLDVTQPEPLPPDSPLWHHPNVIITPHVGAQSGQRAAVVTELFVTNLRRFLAREPLRNLVDKSLGFPRPGHRA